MKKRNPNDLNPSQCDGNNNLSGVTNQESSSQKIIEIDHNDYPELFEIVDLKYSPMLKELLKMYISRQYVENARFGDYYLMAEYELLKREGKLESLFIEERLTNIFLNQEDDDE